MMARAGHRALTSVLISHQPRVYGRSRENGVEKLHLGWDLSSSVSLGTSRRRVASMPLALALCGASKSRAARSTSRAVLRAYLRLPVHHWQQSVPWASVRAEDHWHWQAVSGALRSRRVPMRNVQCRARSVTTGQRHLGPGPVLGAGRRWRHRQLTFKLLGMHACSCKAAALCECAFVRLPIRTVRHTVASHDMQHIACSRTTWRWSSCCHSMKHDRALRHT
jgi:hypothetical protein